MTEIWGKSTQLHRATCSRKVPQTPRCQLPENDHDTEIKSVKDAITTVAPLVLKEIMLARGTGVPKSTTVPHGACGGPGAGPEACG